MPPEGQNSDAVDKADVIRVTRLSGPTAREAEEQAAEYVEEEVARYDGRNLGVRTRRDGSGGLRVDFTYDVATPPSRHGDHGLGRT